MGIKLSGENGQDFELPEAGMHRAICINCFDIGLQPGFNEGDRPREQVVLMFELESKDSKGNHFLLGKFYTKSIHEKSNLGKDLVAWRGRPFTPDELHEFDLDNIKGKPCQVNVTATPNGKMKVASVLPPMKEMGQDGKLHITAHWTPQTDLLYVPPYVVKAREKALPPQEKKQPQRVPGDDFVDDIF